MITVAGRNAVDFEGLKKVKLVRPEDAGSVWQGIKHSVLARVIMEECERRGWEVGVSKFVLGKGGTTMVGAIDLNIPTIEMPDGMGLAIGMSNDNGRRKPLKITVGGEIFCCSNGMITGDVVLKNKHTVYFDLVEEVGNAMWAYKKAARHMPAHVQRMQEFDLSDELADHILLEAGRKGMLPWNMVGKVDKEYRHPSFKDHGRESMWTMFNAFTYIAKQTPPTMQMQRIHAFNSLVTRQMELATAA